MFVINRLKSVLWYSSLSVLFVLISQVAPFSSKAAVSNTPTSGFPGANAAVYASAVGSDGTIYIGGDFTSVGGQTRNHVAAISSSGVLTSWNPNINGAVYSIAVVGSSVVIGGTFTSVGGQARANLAKVSTAGQLDAWAPNPDATVNIIRYAGNLVLVGGDFENISGSARGHLAAYDSSGSLTTWNPSVDDGTVYAIDSDGSAVYFGGDFSSVAGQGRDFLAAVNTTDGALTTWNPGTNGLVATIYYSSNIIYVGGEFTSIGGSTRNSLAAISQAGSVNSWNPNLNQIVGTFVVSGTTGYATGFFTQVGGQSRSYAAAIDLATGAPTTWAPVLDDVAVTVAVSAGDVYLGGNFTTVGGQATQFLAKFEGDETAPPPAEEGSTFAELLPSLSSGDLINFSGVATTYLYWDGYLYPFATTNGLSVYVAQTGELIQTASDSPLDYPSLIQTDSAETVLGIIDEVPPEIPPTLPPTTPPTTPPGTTAPTSSYPTGSLVNDGGTVYLIIGTSKIAFTNFNAFNGLGYSLKYTVNASLANYPLAQSYWIDSPSMAHPWSSWVKYNGTVYYVHETGLIGVPSWQVFLDNGGKDKYILPINDADIFNLNLNHTLPVLTLDDARVY